MNILKKFQRFFVLSVLGGVLAGCALAFLPLVDLNGAQLQRVFAYVLAACFWLGIILEIFFFLLANRQCSKIEERLIKRGEKSFRGAKMGAITFFSCKEAIVADVVAAVSLIAMILLIVFQVTIEWLFIVITVVFFFSFNLHFFLNGKNYKYLKELKKFNHKVRSEDK